MEKRTIFFVVLACVIIMLLLSYNLFTSYNDKVNNQKILNDKESENSSLKVKEYITNIAELKSNTFLHFQPGEKVIYKVTPYTTKWGNSYIIDEYFVKDIEMFNKTECFLIIRNSTKYSDNLVQGNKITKSCIDKDGNILYIDTKTTEYSCDVHTYMEGDNASKAIIEHSLTGQFFYAPWMLALTKEFAWKGYLEVPSYSYMFHLTENKCEAKPTTDNIEYDVYVEDIEIVDNVKCFKVIAKVKVAGKNNIGKPYTTGKLVLWIDINKRIVVQARLYNQSF